MEETSRKELVENLKQMSKILLSQSLEAYMKADQQNELKTSTEQIEAQPVDSENMASTIASIVNAHSSSSSSHSDTHQPKKDSISTHSKEQEESEEDREEWLHYYMFGKINEKQHGPLVDTVKNYLKVIISFC